MSDYFYFFMDFGYVSCFLCVIFWLPCMLAELNRTPFDFSEGESELVSGFNTDLGSVCFTLVFLSEYSSILFFSFLSSFLFFTSSCFLLFLFIAFWIIWVRGVFPRFRYDKLMKLCWLFFIPFLTFFFFFNLSWFFY